MRSREWLFGRGVVGQYTGIHGGKFGVTEGGTKERLDSSMGSDLHCAANMGMPDVGLVAHAMLAQRVDARGLHRAADTVSQSGWR